MTQQAQREIAGRYVLLGEIGRGGMGIVWLAEDRMIGRRVAIKELHLPAGVPADERAVLEQRVLREARAAGRLNDPGVVTVYDVLQESGVTYIVMELIEAPTLAAIVGRQGPLAPEAVARLAGQLLSALEVAHASGVVHRDVKPSNVMVLPNGRVKLTDFGIAQSVDDPRLTTSGVLLGSPTYLAPELIRGGRADAGSDLWALAAALFYAVEGYAAFERSSTAATMHAIVNEVPFLTRCQGPLASAIMGLLNPVPQARLSAGQVRGLLAQATYATQGEQTVVNTPMPAKTARHPVTTHRRRWPFVALAVVLLGGAFVGGWFGGRASESPAADAARLPTMTYGQGGDLPAFELSAGNCSTTAIGKGRSVTSSSSCDDPHDFEVLAAFDPARSDELDFPGEHLTPVAESTCALFFASDLVPADRRGELSYRTLVPTSASWTDARDGRQIFCLLADRDQDQLTGRVTSE